MYIYILHTLFTLLKMWGLLIAFCAWHLEHPSSSSNNSQQAFLHSSVPGTSFPKQKCLGGNVPRVRPWRHQDCQGRNPGGSPRNVSWGTYYTPYLGMTVTVHPQFHGSWGLYDFLKKLFTTLLNDFHADFSVWLSRSSKFPSRIKAFILGPTKIPSLILESLTRVNFSFK